MSLFPLLAPQVSRNARNRGRDYYDSGRVQIHTVTRNSVRAEVMGSLPYDVDLDRQDDHILFSCTCPAYDDQLSPCKHVWATILAADDKGHLSNWDNGKPIELIPVDIMDVFEENEEADEDDYSEFNNPRYSGRHQASNRGIYEPQHRPTSRRLPAPARPPAKAPRPPAWKRHLDSLRQQKPRHALPQGASSWPAGKEILYVVDAAATLAGEGLTVEIVTRERKKDGQWRKPRPQGLGHPQISTLPDVADQQILGQLLGAPQYYSAYAAPTRYRMVQPMQTTLLPMMSQTGRCRLRVDPNDAELHEIQWDPRGPWEFWVEVRHDDSRSEYLVNGSLRRGEERMELSNPVMLVDGGLVFTREYIARLEDFGAFDWIVLLRREKTFSIPADQKDLWLEELLALPNLPRLDLPDELRFQEAAALPRPKLKIAGDKDRWGPPVLRADLFFDYDGIVLRGDAPGNGIADLARRRRILRDHAAERAATGKLNQLGFRLSNAAYDRPPAWELGPRKLPRVVQALVAEGWQVEAEGKLFRRPGAFHIEVTSGIDWFELHGSVEFGDHVAQLPELLAALKRGENTVRLGDGTFGMLPEEWLRKYAIVAGLGAAQDDHLRFTRSQAGLLDALLAAQPEVACDEVFARAREELARFGGVAPADPPPGFVGELREYQREGLGWLDFVRQFGFGGCLADDMGLGKTIQVLALIESRRNRRAQPGDAGDGPRSSLVVVPKSLVFNWKQEAARFTPQLRVLDHTGGERTRGSEHFDSYDMVLTTYGTLRRDALYLKDAQFDYIILDEAQAIKNADTESAKAARLLRGRHRLALSGTPVENHLGELWSLFEFLNPGMLGSAPVLRLGGGELRNPDEQARAVLARALRPFILRRTKEQVARDLPPKLEQTLYCELEPPQRKLYDDLREHYRRALLGLVEREGIMKSKIQILEALLRLRQAACHPALIDKTRIAEPSAKLDMLLPRLAEVLDENHKALVFSQFTSLLSIVRKRLDQEKITYEYLDGQTRDRAAPVERFQTDPKCKLFLISVKAGGLGLNLTAAEYVFLLDPWWNPAVEAQAIDRTHRIGQTRRVFAYRLIARSTVEEKVLELQQTKRDLADAIINADNSLIRDLRREDLELLLS